MISNPLKHLTDSALGYDSQETDLRMVVDSQADSIAPPMNGKQTISTKSNAKVCS